MNTLDEVKASPLAVLTVAEAAAVMRLDPRTVRHGCESGEVPCVRVGRRVMVPRLPFLALLEGGMHDPPGNEQRPGPVTQGAADNVVSPTNSKSKASRKSHRAVAL